MYYYQGQQRFDLVGNPNETAALICLISVFLVGWMAKGRPLLPQILLIGVVVVTGYFLGKTYSRAGFIAAALGATTCIICSHNAGKQRIAVAIIALFAGIFSTTAITNRLSVSTAATDLSVLHRMAVWQDVAVLVSDHPAGVGKYRFKPLFNIFYKRDTRLPMYMSAVNSYLTVAAVQGSLPFVIFTCFVLLGIIASGYGYWVVRAPELGAATGAQVSIAVAAWFSTFTKAGVILVAWGFVTLTSIVYAVKLVRPHMKVIRNAGILAGVLGSLFLCLIHVAGTLGSLKNDVPFCDVTGPKLPNVWNGEAVLQSRKRPQQNRVIVAIGDDAAGVKHIGGLLKALAARADVVALFVYGNGLPSVLQAIRRVKSEENGPPIYIGIGSPGNLAPYIANTGLVAGAASVFSVNYIPRMELTPESNIVALKIPLLIVDAELAMHRKTQGWLALMPPNARTLLRTEFCPVFDGGENICSDVVARWHATLCTDRVP